MIEGLLQDILAGQLDDQLDAIDGAINLRRVQVNGATRETLRPGDTVKFSNLIRPKYLAGMTATVVKLNQKTVAVDCPDDPAYGRFSGGQGIRCPFSLIDGLA